MIDDKSTVYSYVTGQEAWFVAVGQTTMAGQILAMDQLVSGTAAAMGQSASYLSNQKIAGVDTMNLIMVSMPSAGPGAPGDCDSSFVKVNSNGTYEVGLNMNDGQNPALDQFMAGTGGVAPIFQSSAGSGSTFGTAYSDGATGLYVAPGAYATPDTGVYSGNYITLYYIGMGVMLEYYHN